MFCSECGTENPDTNQFCKNCGKPLVRRQPAAQPAVQPAYQPAPAPVASYPVPATVAVPASAAVPKRQWNWPGIISIVIGILSWIILPVILAIGAVVLGTAGLVLFRKTTGRIGISSLIGIALGIASLVVKIVLG